MSRLLILVLLVAMLAPMDAVAGAAPVTRPDGPDMGICSLPEMPRADALAILADHPVDDRPDQATPVAPAVFLPFTAPDAPKADAETLAEIEETMIRIGICDATGHLLSSFSRMTPAQVAEYVWELQALAPTPERALDGAIRWHALGPEGSGSAWRVLDGWDLGDDRFGAVVARFVFLSADDAIGIRYLFYYQFTRQDDHIAWDVSDYTPIDGFSYP